MKVMDNMFFEPQGVHVVVICVKTKNIVENLNIKTI